MTDPAFAETVVRLRAPEASDRYGNPKPDWSAAERAEIAGVSVQPAATPADSSEDTLDQQVTVTGWHLQTRPGVDIDLLPTDRIEWGEATLEVVGKVGRWKISGVVHHVEVLLKEVA